MYYYINYSYPTTSTRSYTYTLDNLNENDKCCCDGSCDCCDCEEEKTSREIADSIVNSIVNKVIFADPATIVYFKDGTKVVVKAQDGERFDKEKGLLMALAKYYIGDNTGKYMNVINYIIDNAVDEDLKKAQKRNK